MELARQAARERCDVVTVAGGDGTVNEAMNGLMSVTADVAERPRLGIIPIGTANDLARGLGLSADLGTSLERVTNGQPVAIDVGRIRSNDGQSRYFAFSAGIGYVGAVAAERFHIRHVSGPWLYLWAGLRVLRRYEPEAPLQIRHGNGRMHHHHLMFLSINNVGTVGGFPLTPGAAVDDGLFDVLSVRYVGRTRRLWLLMLAWSGRHLSAPEFRLVRTDRLEIACSRPVPIHVDGEIYNGSCDGRCHLSVELLPRALYVLA
jgi:diacylglycerol kinase (ATP)